LKSKNLLIISPLFKSFVKDQTAFIKPYFNDAVTLIPIPRFSSLALHLPHVNRNFRFLKTIRESSVVQGDNIKIMDVLYFTLPIPPIRRRNPYLASKSCIKRLATINMNFDLTHCHFLDYGYVGAEIKELRGTPFVVTAHGSDVYEMPFSGSWSNALSRSILVKADKIIAVSQFNASKLQLLGVPSSKLHVIPNGYDSKMFFFRNKELCRSLIGLNNGSKVLLFVGNLNREKGIIDLIIAFKRFIEKNIDCILLIIGSGPLKEVLQKLIKKSGLSSKIFILGGKPHREIPVWMNASDLLVLPSYQEGFPTVLVEAMACGLPILSTRVGGIPEAVCNDSLGALYSPGNISELSEKLSQCLSFSYSAQTITDYAKRYDLARLANQILSVYESLV
jgi:L-malate glycosyltransferase